MASRFAGPVTVENLTRGTAPVNAKSILSVLAAAVQMDDQVRIVAEGQDEDTVVAALCELIQGNFSETR
jgi:phosphotransferase system HPr (HPr) family protein